MSKNYWIISDTHFGHANIIKYCGRPFKDADEMNNIMRAKWNAVVMPGDHVYHLGDVGNRLTVEFLRSLNGKKRLILGNHDEGTDKVLQAAFEKILCWRMFPDWNMLLTHVPVHESSLGHGKGPAEIRKLWNIHGHIHEKPAPSEFHINACVEWTDYAPVNIETYVKEIAKRKKARYG
jgi:calcineurin-like phosphoesterase family protein